MKTMQESSPEKQSDLKPELLKTAVNEQFINYCDAIDQKYNPNWHHEIIAKILQHALYKVKNGEEVRLILELPPRHGKSDQATIKFPSWVLGKYPDIPIVVSSYSADLAEDFGQKTRDLMNDGGYQTFFDTRLRADTKSKGKWLTEEGGGYTAVGVGGPITGRGFKIGIVDDPFKNREEADSDTHREKVWNWWTSTFYTRQEGVSAIIVIMTRWHEDDLVGRLIEQQTEKEKAGEEDIDHWQIIRFPAIAEQDESFRKKGEALWPWKFPIKKLNNIRNAIGIMDFEALYQQNPISSLTAEFKQGYFKHFEETNLPAQFDIDITVDPAISKKKEACNTAIVAVGKRIDLPDWYVLDYKADKFNPGELIDAVFFMYNELRRKYPFANIRVFIEGVAYQQSLEYFFNEEMKRRKEYLNIIMFVDRHDKHQRIRGLIPLYKNGVIHHRPWMTELEGELIKFPKGKTVDIADSLSFHLHVKDNTTEDSNNSTQPDWEPISEYEG